MRAPERYLGKPIRSIQTMLSRIGRAENKDCSLIPDGVYGEQTAEAVRDFQTAHRLLPTGCIDNRTWNEIVNEFVRYSPQLMPAEPIRVPWQPGQGISLLPIQAMLRAVVEVFPEAPDPDADLDAAVGWMREKCGLPCDGELCKLDWCYLCKLYALIAGNENCPL